MICWLLNTCNCGPLSTVVGCFKTKILRIPIKNMLSVYELCCNMSDKLIIFMRNAIWCPYAKMDPNWSNVVYFAYHFGPCPSTGPAWPAFGREPTFWPQISLICPKNVGTFVSPVQTKMATCYSIWFRPAMRMRCIHRWNALKHRCFSDSKKGKNTVIKPSNY